MEQEAGHKAVLSEEEAHLIESALEMREKSAAEVMTPLDKAFMISSKVALAIGNEPQHPSPSVRRICWMGVCSLRSINRDTRASRYAWWVLSLLRWRPRCEISMLAT